MTRVVRRLAVAQTPITASGAVGEAGTARHFSEKLLERGVLCKDTHEQVIRLAPPLIVQKDQLDWLVDQLRFALTP